jgi:ABC-type sugar transport system ATPase subunit
MTAEPLLRVRGLHKRFPGVHALRGVDFDVRAGEVHALVGENGAGKSTLTQILAGGQQPDAGTVEWRGRAVTIPDPHAARQLGVAVVYQERALFGPLSVAENVFPARQPVRGWRIDTRRMHAAAAELLAAVGLDIEPGTALGELSPAQQQLVEVAKALSLDAKLVVFDEPTASLSPAEADRLFGVVRSLRDKGVSVVYITHRLDEVFALADRVTVLKDGAGQGTFAVGELTHDALVAKMVGRDVAAHQRRADPPGAAAPVVLEVRGVTDGRLRGVSFAVRAGEVVALAGLVGAGRTELALAIFGARPGYTGEVLVGGRLVNPNSPARAIAAGIGYLPEDRKDGGLFAEMTVADNVTAVAPPRTGRERCEATEELCRRLRIVCRGPGEPVGNLSGGNQQKVLLARWLLAGPRVLIADEPTRGVDVGAKAEIHALLFDLARRGTAVLVVSSDLPEVLAVADRILVMRDGRLTGELPGAGVTEEAVMRLASNR